jgi:hypothetical protein
MLGNLCKGLIMNPCHSWKCLRVLRARTLREIRIVCKLYNLYIVKIVISTILMIKSGLDPHMVHQLDDDLNCYSLFMVMLNCELV